MHRIRFFLTLLSVALPGAMIAATPAHADLRVCNESSNLISVALGYRAERGWQSEGWWQTPPGDCRVLYQGELDRRYYYIYAADDIGGGDWGGAVFMCSRDESFTIFGVEDCLARGYERTGFFEIDTEGRTDWTLQLTDAGMSSETLTPGGEEDLDEPALLVDPESLEVDADPDTPDTESTDSP